MADLYGYSFSPDLANKFRSSLNNPTGAAQLGPEVGQALRVISLHMPAFTGGAPIAPDSLLRPRLGGFSPDTAVRAQTTGTPPSPSSLPAPSASPSVAAWRPSLGPGAAGTSPFGTTAIDSGPSPSALPPSPTWTFNDPGAGRGTTPDPNPAPSGPIGGSPVGSGIDTQNPLSSLLDAFMRTRGGV